jgi:hypothetical protein
VVSRSFLTGLSRRVRSQAIRAFCNEGLKSAFFVLGFQQNGGSIGQRSCERSMPESLVVRGLSCAAIYELSPISSLGWASALSGLYRRRLLLGLAQRNPVDRLGTVPGSGEPGQVEGARERRIPKPPLPDRAAQLEDERAVLELLDASSTASRSARQKTGQQAESFSTQKSQSGVEKNTDRTNGGTCHD